MAPKLLSWQTICGVLVVEQVMSAEMTDEQHRKQCMKFSYQIEFHIMQFIKIGNDHACGV